MNEADRDGRSAPVARIDLAALRANIAALVGEPAAAIADLRGDAWGHGAHAVEAVLRNAGVVRFLTDGVADSQDTPTIDNEELFGLTRRPGRFPVMSLDGAVLSVKDLRAGEGVSYGYRHRASQDTRVALVTGGYAQGIVRELGGRIDAALEGERCPVIGRIAMDVCVIDIGGLTVERGDRVVFFGDPARGEPALAEWARITGLVPAELVTAVGEHATRVTS